MTTNTVISVNHLSKKYNLTNTPQSTNLFSEAINKSIIDSINSLNPFNLISKGKQTKSIATNPRRVSHEFFWALNDVSFEISRGERIGIIGRNGAGKSTLLKILSRITEPTDGRVMISGRVASLLEVGTGFHAELTGRENIYLNGAILGMTQREIRMKFDDIVAFAEVEKFIDTPVKRYSSGMYVRLAFAVAAHLDPEILIVDEVLAVGDAAFQRKCIGKMAEASSKDGTTVVFVSHNLSQLTSICDTALLLENGKVKLRAGISETISAYTQSSFNIVQANLSDSARPSQASQELLFKSVKVKSPSGPIHEGEKLTLEIEYDIISHIDEYILGATISNSYQTLIECRSTSTLPAMRGSPSTRNLIEVSFRLSLKADTYSLNLGARSSKGLLDFVSNVLQITILPSKSDKWELWNQPSAGVLLTISDWHSIYN